MKHKCPICKAETDSAVHADFPFCSERCRERTWGTGPARGTWCPNRSSLKNTLVKAREHLVLPLDKDWITRMTPTTDRHSATPETPHKKPRLALAIALR